MSQCPRSAARIRPVPLKLSLPLTCAAVAQGQLEQLEVPLAGGDEVGALLGVVLGVHVGAARDQTAAPGRRRRPTRRRSVGGRARPARHGTAPVPRLAPWSARVARSRPTSARSVSTASPATAARAPRRPRPNVVHPTIAPSTSAVPLAATVNLRGSRRTTDAVRTRWRDGHGCSSGRGQASSTQRTEPPIRSRHGPGWGFDRLNHREGSRTSSAARRRTSRPARRTRRARRRLCPRTSPVADLAEPEPA